MDTKKILLAFVILSMVISTNKIIAQAKYDTLIKIEGTIQIVDVTKITTSYISFLVPGSSETYTMQRNEVHKVIYKNGRVEEYNPMTFEVIPEYSWEAVWLTESKKDVITLYKRTSINATSPSSSRSASAAKKNAIIRLQKKAAALKGSVVLVTKKQATGGYGENPGYYIEGIVYGEKPLAEDEIEKLKPGMDAKVVM